LLLGFCFVASNTDADGLPPRHALRSALPFEQTPSLKDAVKPRVIPKAVKDWLDRREIDPTINAKE
jgi:hypothetical protein